MYILFLLIFILVFIVSFVYLFYKLKILDDDINCLYDTCYKYISDSFKRGDNNA